MNGAHLINEELPMSLRSQVSMHLGVTNWGKGKQRFGDEKLPPTPLYGPEGMGVYCGRDTGYAHMLKEIEKQKLQAEQGLAKLFKHLVLPGLDAYAEMEMNGIWVDAHRVAERRLELDVKFDEATAEVMKWVNPAFNAESSDLGNEHFLRRWLFTDPLGLMLEPTARTAVRGDPQVDEKSLAALEHPGATALMARRSVTKGRQFFDAWEEWAEKLPDGNWRLHPFFNLTGAVTGRRSCDRPNLQQVPRNKFYRACIGAPEGWLFLEVDYSQIEVRLAAWSAGEDTMIRIFSDPDGDIYRYTAAKLMHISEDELRVGLEKGEGWAKLGRQKAKAVVLGFLYGMGSSKFSIYAKEMYNVDLTDAEAEEFRQTFFALYPRLVTWHERMRHLAKRDLQVTALDGRIRHLIRMLSNDWKIVGKAERQAINSPIQGMGGDLTLASVISLREQLDRSQILVCGDVHDALLFQIREEHWKKWTAVVLKTMEEVPLLRTVFGRTPPLRLKAEAKVGRYWSESVTYKGDTFMPEFSLEELEDLDVRLAA